MKKSDWGIEIIRVNNGFRLRAATQGDPEEVAFTENVIEDNDEDDLKAGEELLWHVMDFFGFGGSKHDKERLRVVREPGEKYTDTAPDTNEDDDL